MDRVSIYEHPRSSWGQIIQLLESLLPAPLPLLRRLQHPHQPSSLHLIATFPPLQPGSKFPDHPYTIISGDRHDTAITCFAFSSILLQQHLRYQIYETRHPQTPASNNSSSYGCLPSDNGVDPESLEARQLISLLAHVGRVAPPVTRPDIEGTSLDDDAGIIVLGAIDDRLARLLRSPSYPGLSILHAGGFAGGPYGKYVRNMSERTKGLADGDMLSAEKLRRDTEQLPTGLEWGAMSEDDHEIVIQTNRIVRHSSRLAHLRNVAVVKRGQSGKSEPVAWAFIGLDGSLRTLYVVPEWRNKGLAGKVCRRLWAEDVSGGHLNDSWVHCDTAPDNEATMALLTSLGLKLDHMAWWLRIDVSVAQRLAKDVSL